MASACQYYFLVHPLLGSLESSLVYSDISNLHSFRSDTNRRGRKRVRVDRRTAVACTEAAA